MNFKISPYSKSSYQLSWVHNGEVGEPMDFDRYEDLYILGEGNLSDAEYVKRCWYLFLSDQAEKLSHMINLVKSVGYHCPERFAIKFRA